MTDSVVKFPSHHHTLAFGSIRPGFFPLLRNAARGEGNRVGWNSGGKGLPAGNTGQCATASLGDLAFLATEIWNLQISKSLQ